MCARSSDELRRQYAAAPNSAATISNVVVNITSFARRSALRNALSSKSGASAELVASFPSFLACLDSEDFPVKTAALLMVNAAVHYVPHVILGSMKDVVMPALTEFLELKAVRTIDLGPFKHKIDDALPLRKAR